MKRLSLIALALLASACAGAPTGPVETELVDGEYVRRGLRFTNTDVLTIVLVRLEERNGKTRVCGAAFAEGEDFGRGEIVDQVFGAGRLAHGDVTITRSLRSFAGPYEGLGRTGVEAACFDTDVDWRPEFDDPGPLRLGVGRVFTI